MRKLLGILELSKNMSTEEKLLFAGRNHTPVFIKRENP